MLSEFEYTLAFRQPAMTGVGGVVVVNNFGTHVDG